MVYNIKCLKGIMYREGACMEIRTLNYLLKVFAEGNISAAAEKLNITQPTLSRQLASLENELGRQLYHRTREGIVPTEYGVMLAKYAENIVGLASKAEEEISIKSRSVSGSVHIAAGETKAVSILGEAMTLVREAYPKIDFQMYSGKTSDLKDGFARGRYDFLLECEIQSHVNVNVLDLPIEDRWGMVMRSDDPLANRASLRAADLRGRRLITSQQGTSTEPLASWIAGALGDYDVIATYSLGTNCKFLVRQGVGIMFVYEDLLCDGDSEGLRFVPLEPEIRSHHGLIWRNVPLTRQAQIFLDTVKKVIASKSA